MEKSADVNILELASSR